MSRHKNRNIEDRASQPTERDRAVAFRAESFSGPLPPPVVLEQYDRIVPGAAERIIAMAERQATHRQGLEQMVVQGNARAQNRGQVFGFILAISALIVGGILVWYDKKTEGLATIITDIVALVGLFVYGRVAQERERKEKLQAPVLTPSKSN